MFSTIIIKTQFKTQILEEKVGAWINDVAFSTDGIYSFALGHDATLVVVNNSTLQSTTIRYNHQVCNKIVPVNSNYIILIGFDRHFYRYELENDTWKFDTDLSLIDQSESTTSTKETASTGSGSQPKGSIFDKMKMFDVSYQMKQKATTTTSKNNNHSKVNEKLHKTDIIAFSLKNESTLITVDVAGFVKEWKI